MVGEITNVYLPCPVPGPEPIESVAVQILLPAAGAVMAKLTILGVTTPVAQLVQYPADTALPVARALPK